MSSAKGENCVNEIQREPGSVQEARYQVVVIETTEIRANTEAAHIKRLRDAREAKKPQKEVSFIEQNRQKRERRTQKNMCLPAVESSSHEVTDLELIPQPPPSSSPSLVVSLKK